MKKTITALVTSVLLLGLPMDGLAHSRQHHHRGHHHSHKAHRAAAPARTEDLFKAMQRQLEAEGAVFSTQQELEAEGLQFEGAT